jgi:hypothetical protein
MSKVNLSEEYDRDYYQWILKNVQLLKEGRFNNIDAANIAEELESMVKRDKRQLVNRMIVLLTHLLKWHYQFEARSSSWKGTIMEQRRRLQQLLNDSPSLKPLLEEQLLTAWKEARESASVETGQAITTYPEQCIWDTDEILNPEWLPES